MRFCELCIGPLYRFVLKGGHEMPITQKLDTEASAFHGLFEDKLI